MRRPLCEQALGGILCAPLTLAWVLIGEVQTMIAMKVGVLWISCAALGVAIGPPARAALAPVAAVAQDAKAQFEEKLKAADQKDPKALYEVAKWADENGLKTDSKRVARMVIKLDPEHADARAMLGYQKYEGKWLTQREIDREKAKKEEADKEKQGLKKWKNEWVPKEDYDKLEKGLVAVTVNGEKKWVTPIEKERIDKGMTLVDGAWITPEEKEHLAKGEFRVGEKWVSEEEANKVHADFTNPWELEGDYCSFTTTCKRKFAKDAVKQADLTIKEAYRILGVEMPKQPAKIGLIMVKDLNDYNTLGGNQGLDAREATMSSNWACFTMPDQNTGKTIGVSMYEVLDEKNEKGNDDFSFGHVRHAAAAAALKNMSFAEQPPPWFTIGVATYLERYWHPIYNTMKDRNRLSAWSASSLDKEGGMIQLKNYFEPFNVTKQTILQSGLIVSYLVNGAQSPKVAEQWKKCLEAFKAEKQKGLEKGFVKLEILIQKDGDKEIDAYRQTFSG